MNRIELCDYTKIKLRGLQNGRFYLTLETAEEVFILENIDGSMKEYPRVDHALVWLRRMTDLKEVTVDIEIWKNDRKG